MYGYQTRFIPQAHAGEITNLWHLSRVGLSGTGKTSRYDRLLWVTREYEKAHPERDTRGAYKDIDYLTQR